MLTFTYVLSGPINFTSALLDLDVMRHQRNDTSIQTSDFQPSWSVTPDIHPDRQTVTNKHWWCSPFCTSYGQGHDPHQLNTRQVYHRQYRWLPTGDSQASFSTSRWPNLRCMRHRMDEGLREVFSDVIWSTTKPKKKDDTLDVLRDKCWSWRSPDRP